MKFLVLSMLVAAAVAGPTQRFLQPDVSGPTAVLPDRESIVVGPAIINPDPIVIGPAIVNPGISVGPAFIDNYDPISIGPAIVDESVAIPAPVATPEAPKPVVQIIINVNGQGQIIGIPEVVVPGPVETENNPEPVIVVEQPSEPINVVEVAPGVIGTPVLPGTPVITLPDELN